MIKNVKIRVTLSLQGHFTELLKSHRQKRNEVQNEVSVTPVSVRTDMSSSGSGRKEVIQPDAGYVQLVEHKLFCRWCVHTNTGRWMDTRILNLSAILPYRNSICRPGYEGSKLS